MPQYWRPCPSYFCHLIFFSKLCNFIIPKSQLDHIKLLQLSKTSKYVFLANFCRGSQTKESSHWAVFENDQCGVQKKGFYSPYCQEYDISEVRIKINLNGRNVDFVFNFSPKRDLFKVKLYTIRSWNWKRVTERERLLKSQSNIKVWLNKLDWLFSFDWLTIDSRIWKMDVVNNNPN